jgi:hypothetical protein
MRAFVRPAARGGPLPRAGRLVSPADQTNAQRWDVTRPTALGTLCEVHHIFELAIQSISLAPAGFIACLVDTTSIGLIVTKS